MHRAITTSAIAAIAIGSGFASSASADILTFEYTASYTDGNLPTGVDPFVTATFEDVDLGGGNSAVKLTLDAGNLEGGEFVSDVFFNLNPSLSASNLSFTGETKTGSFDSPAISKGTDNQRSTASYDFDIKIAFTTMGGPGGGVTKRFGANDVYMVQISSSETSTLTVADFDFLASKDNEEATGLPTALHVQGSPNGDGGTYSSNLTTPEPGTAVLCGLGALAMLGRTRRQA